MKNVKYILVLGAFFSLGLEAYSQVKPFNSIQKRNHIGLNSQYFVNRLISENDSLPFQLLYKRQIKNKNQAFLVGLIGQYKNSRSKKNHLGEFERNYLLNYGVSLGYEWQENLGKRWQISYGFSVPFEILNNHQYILEFFPPEEGFIIEFLYYDYNKYLISAGISPFVSPRFFINKSLYIDLHFKIESIFWVIKQRGYVGTVLFSGEKLGSGYSSGDSMGFNTNTNFFSGIQIHYLFNSKP